MTYIYLSSNYEVEKLLVQSRLKDKLQIYKRILLDLTSIFR